MGITPLLFRFVATCQRSLCPFDTAKLGTNQILSKLFAETIWIAKILII